MRSNLRVFFESISHVSNDIKLHADSLGFLDTIYLQFTLFQLRAVYKWEIVMNSEQILDLTLGGIGLLKRKIPILIGRDLIQQKKKSLSL
jgi:hypothetical protein